MEGREPLRRSRLVALGVVLWLSVSAAEGPPQSGRAASHTISITVLEAKGSTTVQKLAPPPINPETLSKGYEFKAPGVADKRNRKKWQVSSYRFDPGFITVQQRDIVNLIAFVVNGDEHEVGLIDPEGHEVVARKEWNRGREY